MVLLVLCAFISCHEFTGNLQNNWFCIVIDFFSDALNLTILRQLKEVSICNIGVLTRVLRVFIQCLFSVLTRWICSKTESIHEWTICHRDAVTEMAR